MSRHIDQVPVSVDALLPSLGVLSLNHASTPKPAPIAAGDYKKQKLETGPSTGESKDIAWIQEDGTFNERAHKSLVFAQNAAWVQFYPPDEGSDHDGYKNWTSFFPENKLQIANPHWLRDGWLTAKHGSLTEARDEFFTLLSGSLKDLMPPEKGSSTDNTFEDLKADRETSLAHLRSILTSDADNADPEKLADSRDELAKMLRQDGAFGQHKRKRSSPFKLPPGWLMMYKAQSASTLKCRFESSGKVGAYSNPAYVGPQFSSWDIKNASSLYSPILQDTPIQAWLVYLMYQRSSKTNDPGLTKAKKTDTHTDNQEPVQAPSSAGPDACGDDTSDQTSVARAQTPPSTSRHEFWDSVFSR